MKKPRWLNEIKALGWDLDGTLYPAYDGELSGLIREKLYKVVAERLSLNFSQAKREYEKRYRMMGSNTKALNSFGIEGTDFFVKFWDEVDLERFIVKDERVVKMFVDLKDKRHFIISNSNRVDQIERKLMLIGLKPSIFEFIISTVGLRAVKPDPEPFVLALEKLKLKARQVLFVGDREDADIKGAHRVGMRTCLVWGESRVADLSLDVVYDVRELFEV